MKIAFYTGPTAVGRIAEKMREAGIEVFLEGTERVYVLADAPPLDPLLQGIQWIAAENERVRLAREAVLEKLLLKHGTKFGLDVRL